MADKKIFATLDGVERELVKLTSKKSQRNPPAVVQKKLANQKEISTTNPRLLRSVKKFMSNVKTTRGYGTSSSMNNDHSEIFSVDCLSVEDQKDKSWPSLSNVEVGNNVQGFKEGGGVKMNNVLGHESESAYQNEDSAFRSVSTPDLKNNRGNKNHFSKDKNHGFLGISLDLGSQSDLKNAVNKTISVESRDVDSTKSFGPNGLHRSNPAKVRDDLKRTLGKNPVGTKEGYENEQRGFISVGDGKIDNATPSLSEGDLSTGLNESVIVMKENHTNNYCCGDDDFDVVTLSNIPTSFSRKRGLDENALRGHKEAEKMKQNGWMERNKKADVLYTGARWFIGAKWFPINALNFDETDIEEETQHGDTISRSKEVHESKRKKTIKAKKNSTELPGTHKSKRKDKGIPKTQPDDEKDYRFICLMFLFIVFLFPTSTWVNGDREEVQTEDIGTTTYQKQHTKTFWVFDENGNVRRLDDAEVIHASVATPKRSSSSSTQKLQAGNQEDESLEQSSKIPQFLDEAEKSANQNEEVVKKVGVVKGEERDRKKNRGEEQEGESLEELRVSKAPGGGAGEGKKPKKKEEEGNKTDKGGKGGKKAGQPTTKAKKAAEAEANQEKEEVEEAVDCLKWAQRIRKKWTSGAKIGDEETTTWKDVAKSLCKDLKAEPSWDKDQKQKNAEEAGCHPNVCRQEILAGDPDSLKDLKEMAEKEEKSAEKVFDHLDEDERKEYIKIRTECMREFIQPLHVAWNFVGETEEIPEKKFVPDGEDCMMLDMVPNGKSSFEITDFKHCPEARLCGIENSGSDGKGKCLAESPEGGTEKKGGLKEKEIFLNLVRLGCKDESKLPEGLRSGREKCGDLKICHAVAASKIHDDPCDGWMKRVWQVWIGGKGYEWPKDTADVKKHPMKEYWRASSLFKAACSNRLPVKGSDAEGKDLDLQKPEEWCPSTKEACIERFAFETKNPVDDCADWFTLGIGTLVSLIHYTINITFCRKSHTKFFTQYDI